MSCACCLVEALELVTPGPHSVSGQYPPGRPPTVSDPPSRHRSIIPLVFPAGNRARA